MAITRRNFTKGLMNQDIDERLIPDGQYRYAENIIVLDSEGSDAGSIQNSLSNKKITDLNLGKNVKCLRGISDEANDKIYWFTTSNYGCFLLEYDYKNSITSIVLGDTRPVGSRVLDLKEDFLITGIDKIVNDDYRDDLLLWTNGDIQPCCINIERAKTYGINGFEKEDIYLIKKAPRYAPTIQLTYSSLNSNDIEEKFLTFAYRYQYLDNEWSPLSSFTNYAFSPGVYDIDYYTYDNLGMVNKFNSVNIKYNTGDKRVKNIQLLVKESNSNNIYVIENIDKKKLGYVNDVDKTFLFINNKIYTILPEVELYRTFDNVPLKAKTQTIINNRILFGNYVEGYDIVDDVKNKILINYKLNLKSQALNTIEDFALNFTDLSNSNNHVEVTNTNTNVLLKKDSKLRFYLYVQVKEKLPYFTDDSKIYENAFEYILLDDYLSINDLMFSSDFQLFFNAVKQHFADNYELILPGSLIKVSGPELVMYNLNQGIEIIQGEYFNTSTNTQVFLDFKFHNSITNVTWTNISSAASCKSNRSYDVAIMYLDEFDRKTVALVSSKNTLYIPNGNSEFKNTISVELLSKPPFWADRYKFLIKTEKLDYYTITVNQFFREEAFVWVKLEGSEKDKIKIGDYLIVKRIKTEIINAVNKIKILDIQYKDKNFITDNDLKEDSGLYFKIKPNSFQMNEDEIKILYNVVTARSSSSSYFPTVYLNLFSTEVTPGVVVHKELKASTIIKLVFYSKFNYKSGWTYHKFERQYSCQRNYANFEDWYNEVCLGRTFTDEDGHNYQVELVLGNVTTNIFSNDINGKYYLKVVGLESGGSNDRNGYVEANITINESAGDYIFETIPKKNLEDNLYFETTETFDIIDGNHQGNIQNQDLAIGKNAIIDLSYFNCFSQANGVESYRIKDAFNSNWMNTDFKPTSTTTDEYKSVVRTSDLTISEPYNNSTSYNGLNAFIVSNSNFKELDKQYGSVQHLLTRDNDIVVFQEEKTSKVLFNKNLLFNADGNTNVTSIDTLLGGQVFYGGENGVGTSPESIAVNDYRVYFANPLRGLIHRLSIDGIEDITNGLESYFRNLFNKYKKSKKIAGYDPYFNQYIFNFSEIEPNLRQANCGNIIIQYNQIIPFNYILNLNEIVGDVILNYNILSGNANITAIYDGVTYSASNVNGLGTLTIPRLSDFPDTINISISSADMDNISFEITNICPLVGQHHYSSLHYSSLHYST